MDLPRGHGYTRGWGEGLRTPRSVKSVRVSSKEPRVGVGVPQTVPQPQPALGLQHTRACYSSTSTSKKADPSSGRPWGPAPTKAGNPTWSSQVRHPRFTDEVK